MNRGKMWLGKLWQIWIRKAFFFLGSWGQGIHTRTIEKQTISTLDQISGLNTAHSYCIENALSDLICEMRVVSEILSLFVRGGEASIPVWEAVFALLLTWLIDYTQHFSLVLGIKVEVQRVRDSFCAVCLFSLMITTLIICVYACIICENQFDKRLVLKSRACFVVLYSRRWWGFVIR